MTKSAVRNFSHHGFIESLCIIEFWKTLDGEGWVTIHTNHGVENIAVKSDRLRKWLVRCYSGQIGSAPSKDFLLRTIELMDAKAAFDGVIYETHFRSAGSIQSEIYIDLGSEDWSCLKLTENGWRICQQSEYKFRRTSSMRALPVPALSGSVDDLRHHLNCESEEDWVLLLTWIVSTICHICPFPILVLTGGPGSAKSTTSKLIRFLIDPSEVMTTRCPKDPSDLTSAVANSYMMSFDNISHMPRWLSDELCMVASGSGIRERRLHTNSEEKIISGGRAIVVNGIGDFANRADIIDRSVIVKLDIPKVRRPEKLQTREGVGLWDAFEARKPSILGSLYDIVCKTMKIHSKGQCLPQGNPRMVDFAVLGNALEVVVGWEQGTFDRVYGDNRAQADEIAIENSPIMGLLNTAFLDRTDEWIGSATDFKEKILAYGGEKYALDKLQAMQASEVGSSLSMLSQNLSAQGWKIVQLKRSGKGRKWSIKSPYFVNKG